MPTLKLNINSTTSDNAIRRAFKDALDELIKRNAVEGFIHWPYCPDCRTLMEKTVAYYKDDAYPVWECECSLTGLHDLIEDELS